MNNPTKCNSKDAYVVCLYYAWIIKASDHMMYTTVSNSHVANYSMVMVTITQLASYMLNFSYMFTVIWPVE